MSDDKVTMKITYSTSQDEYGLYLVGEFNGTGFEIWQCLNEEGRLFIKGFSQEKDGKACFTGFKTWRTIMKGVAMFYESLEDELKDALYQRMANYVFIFELLDEINKANVKETKDMERLVGVKMKRLKDSIESTKEKAAQKSTAETLLKLGLFTMLMNYAPDDIMNSIQARDPKDVPVQELVAIAKLYVPAELLDPIVKDLNI